MKSVVFMPLKGIILGFYINYAASFQTSTLEIRMPNVHPTKNDEYVTRATALHLNETHYIVKFQPKASMDIVHHMILSGCKSTLHVSDYATCLSSTQIFYAWARNAPALTLPEDVGFKIGGDSGINYIQLQVHYGNVSNIDSATGDTSGVDLIITNKPQSKRAGVFLMSTGGCIKSQTTEYFETACNYTPDIPVHPFAFRTHTHTRGLVVSGYNIINKDGTLDWQLIGKQNPQLPQFFYPVKNQEITIQQGNLVAARCTMQNNETRTICVGGTHMDEMCNFYTMYYVNGDQLPAGFGCGSGGPPYYHWSKDEKINNIPNDASSL